MTLPSQDRPTRQSEVTLMQAVAAGEHRAQKILLDRVFNRARATAHYLAAGDRDVDDLVQISLMAILRSAKSYRGEGPLTTWANRIIVRASLRWLRRRRWREERVSLVDLAETTASHTTDLERARMRRRIAIALAKLPVNLRVAVVLRLVHGYRVAEIADIVEAPANTVRDRLRRGRALLRRELGNAPQLADYLGRRPK